MFGKTPADVATIYSSVKSFLLQEEVERLVARGEDINFVDDNGQTLLHKAVKIDDIKLMNYLFQFRVDPTKKDSNGLTPLHYAVEGEKVEMIKMLIKAEANINAVDNCGQTALHLAAKKSYLMVNGLKKIVDPLEIINCLLQNGADPTKKDRDGKIPADIAEDEEIRQVLLKAKKAFRRRGYCNIL